MFGLSGQSERAGRRRIFSRSCRIQALIFLVIFCVMMVVATSVFGVFARQLSSEYTERYAMSAAEVLGARMGKEIGLLAAVAHSPAVAGWLADEYNEEKKALAYAEMLDIVGQLYSFNLYVSVSASRHEYKVESGSVADEARPFAVLDTSRLLDSWYFDCIKADGKYTLSVNIDHLMKRKRIWLDYKVMREDNVLGIVSTGMEFSHVAGELFAHSHNMRGLLIDEKGIIHIDSSLMGNKDFLYNKFENSLSKEFPDSALSSAIQERLTGGRPHSVRLDTGPYRHMAIMPIAATKWSVLILSGGAPPFDLFLFLPAAVAMLVLFIAFAISSGAANYYLIFRPLGRLDKSLTLMGDNNKARLYGIDRDDELGYLAKTIQDLFDKTNIDPLTGLNNRRFMETNLARVIKLLSRSNGPLSILMLDIDFFKKYNDTYGHAQGDECLKAVAKELNGERDSDFTARYGGEEFIVVLPNTDEHGACVVAKKLLERVRALNISHTGNTVAPCVTVSIGVSTGTVAHGQHWDTYVERADEALYMSKQNGRNQYTYLPHEDDII